ncbi:helix-loop-helix DNA-binding domain-containing protein [Phascolomyces articulosus]|uniref:Helix-loop-helix DNA-binding domain-containing protein n=1 Tax=Phascolomyces articulosus TaxID=60185 RepID=A0AAD5KSI3_9FUNG|nr:helix-loop-helix DNA-binding domain-containing protein [Phascolomyces articulosus]
MTTTTPTTTKSTIKNKSHNAIERRYRNNINERIAELKAAVPALQHTKQPPPPSTNSTNSNYVPEEDQDSEEYIDGVAVATKINKATIMRKATEYIVHLQNTNEQLNKENQILEQLIHQLPGGIPVLTRYRTMKHQQQKQRQQEENEEQQLDFPLENQQGQHHQQNSTFMALFMCLSFSMDQNMTSSTTSTNPHHRNVFDASSPSSPYSSPTYDLWAYIRLTLLITCLVVLLFRRRHEEKQSTFMLLYNLATESVQLMIRHTFGWNTTATPNGHGACDYQEQETERWIDIHASPSSPLLLRLYACIRMINVAPPHLLTYAYACSAMQFYPYSTWVARYFWRLAMYETDDDMLVWDVHQQPPSEDAMLDSQAWKEAVERNADLGELSRLHLLDNLRTELGRLIISVTSSPPPLRWVVENRTKSPDDYLSYNVEEEQTAFERILYEEHQRHRHPFPRWLAAVGATVEALWQSDIEAAERAVAVHTMEQEQDLVKVKIKLVLQAAIRLQKGDLTGVDLLEETAALQKKIKKSFGYRQRRPTMTRPIGLEGETMALAEFVACLAGLHAWIEAWRLGIKGAAEQIKAQTLVLRRMMRCSTLEKLPAHQVLVDRLSRLGYFVSPNGSDDEEEEEEDLLNDDEQTRPSKALDILRGLA